MPSPTQCPVCGTVDIQQVMRKASLSLSLGTDTDKVSGVMAYRCANGHIFLTLPLVNDGQKVLESIA